MSNKNKPFTYEPPNPVKLLREATTYILEDQRAIKSLEKRIAQLESELAECKKAKVTR